MVFTVEDLCFVTGGTSWKWITNVEIVGFTLNRERRITTDKTGKTLPTRSEVLSDYGSKFGTNNVKLGFAYKSNGDIYSWDRFVAVYVKRNKEN
jgi:hypothetical protein